jgi:predicted metal-binding protein
MDRLEAVDTSQSIIVCTRCRDDSPADGAGERPRALLGEILAADFQVRGVACMAGCSRPLAVAFLAPDKASYLFGDIETEAYADHLVAFARFYRSLPDGWCNEGHRPAGLAGKTLARIPAAFFSGAA